MFDFSAFFKRFFGSNKESKTKAKNRLNFILVSDRTCAPSQVMEDMRREIIEVISKYMDIDTDAMQICLERQEGTLALAANIPVLSVKCSSEENNAVKASEKPSQHFPEPKLEASTAKTQGKKKNKRRNNK